MLLDVAFRQKARNDLRSIYLFIARSSGSPAVADRIVDRLEAACLSLCRFPNRGTPRDDWAPGARTLAVPHLAVIVYRVESRKVRILAIIYAGGDLEKHAVADQDR